MRQWPDGSTSNNFLIDVAFGNVPGYRLVRKFGRVILSTLNVEEDIWSFGGDYIFPSTLPHFISSSDNGDAQEIEIIGLDHRMKFNTDIFPLVGQTKTSIGDWYRIFRIKNISSPGVNFAGNIYAYEENAIVAGVPQTTSKITAYIDKTTDLNQTNMTMFTVPIDEEGLIIGIFPVLSSRIAQSITGDIIVRDFGSVERKRQPYSINSTGTTFANIALVAPIVLVPGADVRVAATGSANSLPVAFTYAILLRKL